MKIPKELNTITPLSKILAAVLFISLPFIGFFLGMRYAEMPDRTNKEKNDSMIACTQDAKICPDGTYVSRQGPSCEFALCPTIDSDETANWKTYVNKKYGFEFRYPDDHTVYSDVNQEKEVLIPAISTSDTAKVAVIEAHEFCCEPSTVSFSIKTSTKNAREWSKEYLKKWEGETSTIRDAIFAGKPAVEANGRGGYNPPYRLIVVSLDASLLVIVQDMNEPLLSEVLSTFQFTD